MLRVQALRRTQILPITLGEAWNFFSNPMNLADITPDQMGFQVLTRTPEAVYPGLMIHYRVGILPLVRVEWLTEITVVREPEYFVDEQRMGPYRLWHHEHRFREVPGGVEVDDLVHYALPFGLPGRLIAGGWVSRSLEGIFDYRHRALERRFPLQGSAQGTVGP